MLTASVLVSLIASVSAHSIFQQLYVNGASPGQKVGIRMPVNNNPVQDVTSGDMTCNATPGSATDIINIPAGATLTAEWHQSTDPSQYGTGDDPIAASHHGPFLTYVAKVDNSSTANAAGLSWVKIAHEGFTGGQWAVDKMVANKGKYDFVLPSCLADGQYLLRHELLALHSATQPNGAQFYMSCVQIQITGGGSAAPAGVSIPGVYSATDPGILVNIYGDNSGYTIPGPAPMTCDGAPSAPAPASSSQPAPASSSAPAPASSSAPQAPASSPAPAPAPSSTQAPAPSGGQAAVWGQCGGTNFAGPTGCPSNTSCKVLNPYYSQCIPN